MTECSDKVTVKKGLALQQTSTKFYGNWRKKLQCKSMLDLCRLIIGIKKLLSLLIQSYATCYWLTNALFNLYYLLHIMLKSKANNKFRGNFQVFQFNCRRFSSKVFQNSIFEVTKAHITSHTYP